MQKSNVSAYTWDQKLAWYFDQVGRETSQSPLYMPFDDMGFEWKTGKRRFVYGSDISEARRKEKAVLKAMATAHEVYAGHSKVYYEICAITSGLRGYELALKNKDKMFGLRDDGLISTKNLSRNLGGDAFVAQVIYPNLKQSITRGRILEQDPKNAEINFYLPGLGEHTTFDDRRNLGLNPDEVTYMSKHYPEIASASGVVHTGDWFSSRNGALESWAGTAIQLGLHPFRPYADIEMVDEKSDPVSLYERTQPIFDITHMITSKGFMADTHATVLLRSLYIDDVLKGFEKPGFEFDPARVHNDLKFRQPQEEELMEVLKKDAASVLYQNCRGFTCMDDMPPDYLQKLMKRTSPKVVFYKNGNIKSNAPVMPDVKELKAEDYDLDPVVTEKILGQDFNPAKFYGGNQKAKNFKKVMEYERTLKQNDHASHPYTNPPWNHIEQNAVRRSLIRLSLNAMGITLGSNKEPQATFVFCDPKINRWTLEWAQKNDIKDGTKLLENADGTRQSGALRKAIDHAALYAEHVKENIIKHHPSRFVMTMYDVGQIDQSQKNDPYAFSDYQSSHLSSPGRMILRDEAVAAFCDEVIFDATWAQSPDLVYHMGRAFMIQNSLIERPPELPQNELKINVLKNEAGHRYVFDTAPITMEKALYEISTVIEERQQRNLPVSPLHGMVFLQLKDIMEYNTDFYRSRGQKDVAGDYRAMISTITRKEDDFDKKIERAQQIIAEQALQIFPDISWLDGLPEHVRRIYFKAQGQQEDKEKTKYPDGKFGYIPRL